MTDAPSPLWHVPCTAPHGSRPTVGVERRREARWRGMHETFWARGCRRAVEACWLLVFAVVPVYFSVDVYINFIHDKIPLFRSLVELGLLAATFWYTLENGSASRGPAPPLRGPRLPSHWPRR